MHILKDLERLKRKKKDRILSAAISFARQIRCTEAMLLNKVCLEFTFPCTLNLFQVQEGEAVRSKSITVKIKTHRAIKESKLKIRSYMMKIPVNLTATDLGPGFCLKRWKLQ